MNRFKKIIIIFALLFFSFFANNKVIFAQDSNMLETDDGACYCCTGSSLACIYDWKASYEDIGDNCRLVDYKSKLNCNGYNDGDATGACWYCDQGSQGIVYKWTDDGASPAYDCTFASGIGKTACTGTPADHEGAGVGEMSDNEYYENEATTGPTVVISTSDASCSGIIGSGDFRTVLTEFLDMIRILAIAMVVVFSTIDFAKALIAQDSDALKKSTSHAFKRLIIAIVIFFTPVLLNILLGLIGISGICI